MSYSKQRLMQKVIELQDKLIIANEKNNTETAKLVQKLYNDIFMLPTIKGRRSYTVESSDGWSKVVSTPIFYEVGKDGQVGIVFYDKGDYSDGWRYLEAAPANTEFLADWYTAIQRCKKLDIGGYTDWRLPTKDELDLMYEKLKLNALGDFRNDCYWSSSQSNRNIHRAWSQDFDSGYQYDYTGKDLSRRVRAIRAF